MRCQYCGKRLPLFRKLKDGEFCSAAHREQFIAQADQLALATLQEQRERTIRARAEKLPVSASPVPGAAPVARTARGPSKAATPVMADASFSDRYLVSAPAPLRLGQLARLPQEPTAVALLPCMPERTSNGHRYYSRDSLSSPRLETLPADRMLAALSDHGASAGSSLAPLVEPLVEPVAAVRVIQRERGPLLPASGLMALRTPEWAACEFGLLLPAPTWPASRWFGKGEVLEYPRLNLVPDPARLPTERPAAQDSISMASAVAFTVPKAQLGPMFIASCVPVPRPMPLPVPEIQVDRDARWSPGRFKPLGLTPLQAAAVSIPVILSSPASAVRFPALMPTFSMMPPRPRAALRLFPAALELALQANAPEEMSSPGRLASPVLTPVVSSEVAIGALSAALQIEGRLADLLPAPTELAEACRIRWRFEAQAPPAFPTLAAFHTLAVRSLAIGVEIMRPGLMLAAAGPRFAEKQVPLNAVLRPICGELALGTDSVSFHLEPKVLQPRLRATPDPARQGGSARSRGKNHADAAVASIKIPVLRRFWAHAPADIRWVALIIPLVLFLAWYSWTPNGKALNKQAQTADLAVDTSGVQTAFASFKSRISSRAAVELSEDFRAGLADWQGAREDWAANWAYDQAGFVRPGNLAIFTPTIALQDYNFEFMGQIENRALSWVYRAKDSQNYYLGKLIITQSGPVPEVALVRSVVKNGRESLRKVTIMPMNLRSDTLYRVRVEVNGSDFTTSVLGQVVDTFNDSTHTQGGIGFLGGRGETGRVRWVEVSHQYDTLGRLCAMLVPYGLGGTTVQANTLPSTPAK